MSERPVAVEPQLPHPALPSANWADRYDLRVRAAGLTAEDAARMAVGRFPLWVRMLMRVRNAIGGLVGLKPSTYHSPADTEMIGIFPVVSRSAGQILLGFDDRHLDFRIVLDVADIGDRRQVIGATTLVNRKILLGRIYIAVITPFHRLVVGSMLANVGRQLDRRQSIGVAL